MKQTKRRSAFVSTWWKQYGNLIMSDTYTIGQISKLSGASVRRIRFYSDKGLLPPAARTSRGYRVYSETDLARLDLIRALRDAGVSLEAIRKIFSRRLTLAEVLEMRLGTLEAEIASRRRIAAVLRATLRATEATEANLRRLWTVTTLSKARLQKMIEDFVDKVIDGFHVDDAWKAQMIEASTVELPDQPTPEQIDAWNEIIKMITDTAFIRQMRSEMGRMWNEDVDLSSYAKASNEILAKAREAIGRGEQPTSSTAIAIAREWLERLAKAMNRDPDDKFFAWAREHHIRSLRYHELLATLYADDRNGPTARQWVWINEAIRPLLDAGAQFRSSTMSG
jgi:DNA-binding transcriptional MerR regulator